MSSIDKILDAFGRLIQLLVQLFGPRGAVWFIAGAFAALLFFRWLAHRRAERGWRLALDEKERSIQRLAAVERTYRLEALVRDRGMSLKDAERLLIRRHLVRHAQRPRISSRCRFDEHARHVQRPASDAWDRSDARTDRTRACEKGVRENIA